MKDNKLLTYNEAFKEYGKAMLDTLRKYDEMERKGELSRSQVDELMASSIESQVYAIANVVVKHRMAEYKNQLSFSK